MVTLVAERLMWRGERVEVYTVDFHFRHLFCGLSPVTA